MRAKKSLGQHFLKSGRALSVIVETGEIHEGDRVLEIGPGTGALTERLLRSGARVIAVEKDDGLFELLKEKYQKEILSGQLILVHEDILNFEPQSCNLEAGNYKLVANIPYNITGAILKKFLETDYQPERIVLLVQKEVAERIVARKKPLDSARGKESILSLSIKAYGMPRYIETVKAGSFAPAPKVDSAIIAIENVSKDFFQSASWRISEKEFFNTVRAGFTSKRKKLSSNLSKQFPNNKVREAFQKLKLDDNLRAEDADIKIWKKLVYSLYGACGVENPG